MVDATVPHVRVVVLNWNNDWLTTRCVRSILASDHPADRLEVVVADNGSIDGSLSRLRADLPLDSGRVRIIENGANLGFAEGCNRGMRDLDGVDFVALINNDATVESGWLGPLLEQMADEEVGAVAPKLLLESPFVTVDLDELVEEAEAGADRVCPSIDAIRVDGIDTTARCVFEGIDVRVHPELPLEFNRRVRNGGCVHVPVGADESRPPRIELDITVDRSGVAAVLDGVEVVVDQPGSTTIALTSVGPRHRRINNLGTTIMANTEGSDRWFGVLDRDDLPTFDVPGFCGGAVLLRATMLREIGLLEPSYFAYYEDTDLSWRARRAGWRIVCAPESVVNHLHGGSGGAAARGFFFLNYRNWLLTVLRNGSLREVLTAGRWSWRFSWPATRHNLIAKVVRRSVPRPAITLAWVRVLLGVLGAVPNTVRSRFGRRVPGREETNAVRSRLQPRGRPGAPKRRPGGPVLVYIDVTPTLRLGWRAGIQRVTTTLLAELPRATDGLQIVPVRWSAPRKKFRRITNEEYESLLAPTGGSQPTNRGSGSALRVRVGDMARGLGLAPLARRARELRELRYETRAQRDLLIDHFEPGSVFFDCDAGWNNCTPERRELLTRLSAHGVRLVSFVYDLFPITNPEWFDSATSKVAISFLRAHLATDDAIICSATSVVDDLRGWAKDLGLATPEIVVTPLGFETPGVERRARPEQPSPSTPYVLMVGTVEPRKNHAMALSAMERLWAEGIDLDLVVVGRAGWRNDRLIERLRAAAETNRVRWFDSAGDDELEELYAGAHLVVVASHSEGYGLPVVEALSRGIAVVSSNGGALPEAGGESVEYFDPGDVDRLTELVRRHVTDPAHHRVQQRLAASHVGTTWREAASQIGGVLVRVGRGDSVRSH